MLIDCRISADRSPRPGKAGGRLHHAAMAVMAALAVLMDRIGLAVILAALGLVVLHAIWRKRGWPTAAWLFAAIVVCQIYHSFIGPALNARFSGFGKEVVAQPFTTTGLAPWELVSGSARYVANTIPHVFGGLVWWAALPVAAAFALLAWRQSPEPGKGARFAFSALAALAALATAFAITMATIYVLPSIPVIPSANGYYYPVYWAALLWLGLAIGSAAIFSGPGGRLQRAIPWCLAALLVSNLIHLPVWEARLRQCKWYALMVKDTARVRQSCVEKKMHPEISGRHRRLFSVIAGECPWLSSSYWPTAEPLTGFFVAGANPEGPPRFWIGPGAKLRVTTLAKGKYEVKLAVAGTLEGDNRLTITSKESVVGEFDLPARPGETATIAFPLDLKKGSTTLDFSSSRGGPALSSLGVAELSEGIDAPIGCALVGMPVLRKAGE